MPSLSNTLIVALIAVLLSCSNGSKGNDSTSTSEQTENPQQQIKLQQIANELIKRRNSLVEEQPNGLKCGHESYNDPKSLCFLEDVVFSPAPERADSIGKRVLILDSEMTYFGASIFKKSVIGMYQFNPENSVAEPFPYDLFQGQDRFKIPRFYWDIHSKLFGDEPTKIPNKAFRSIDTEYSKNIRGYFVNAYSQEYNLVEIPSLGTLSLAYLYDHIPNAQFVLVNEETNSFYDVSAEQLCSIANKDPQSIGQMVLVKLEQIREIVARHRVNYIVVPSTLHRDKLHDIYKASCNEEPTDAEKESVNVLFDAISQYRNGLANIDGAIVFQSATGNYEGEDHYTCKNMAGRIVVGPTKNGVVFDDLSSKGSRDRKRYVDNLRGYECADIFVHNARTILGEDTVSFTASFSFLEFNDKKSDVLTYNFNRRLSPAVALAYSQYRIDAEGFKLNELKGVLQQSNIVSPTQHFQTPSCNVDRSYCLYNFKYF